MHSGDEDPQVWLKGIPPANWTVIPEPKKIKVNDTHSVYKFKGVDYEEYSREVKSQGFVEEYWSEQQCVSGLVSIPGVQLLSPVLMTIVYFLFMVYLFLGIAISADIFMEAIEVITSKTKLVNITDVSNGENY